MLIQDVRTSNAFNATYVNIVNTKDIIIFAPFLIFNQFSI